MASKLWSIFLSLLLIFIASNESNVEALNRRSFPHENIRIDENSNLIEKKWISRLFLEAEMSFDIHPNVSSRCKYDYELYLSHLKNQSVWAVRMMESSQWPKLGLFAGTNVHFGNWDECLRSKKADVRGQYCLVQSSIQFDDKIRAKKIESHWPEWPDEDSSAWEVIQGYDDDPFRVSRKNFMWTLCVPSSCTASDIQNSLQKIVTPIFRQSNLSINVTVDPIFCNSHNDHDDGNPIKFYYVCTLFAVLICLSILASIADVGNLVKKTKGRPTLIECISLPYNYKTLIDYSSAAIFPENYFLKFALMNSVIFCHTFEFNISFPLLQTEVIEMMYSIWNWELCFIMVVDIYFVISGYFWYHQHFKPMEKGGVHYFVISLLFRWIRIVIPFMFIMLLFTCIIPFLGDGPFWNYRLSADVANCESNWWLNFFGIHNIFRVETMCISHSWYMAVDLQLMLLGNILLLAMTKNRKLGYSMVLMAFIIGIVATFYEVYTNQYNGIFRDLIPINQKEVKYDHDWPFYVSTWPRIPMFLIGFMAPILTEYLKKRNCKFSQKQIFLTLFFTLLIGMEFQMYGTVFYMMGRAYSAVESATFAVFGRIVFAIPFVSLHCMHFTSGLGDVLNKMFGWNKLFIFVGRLVYSTYLSNYVVLAYFISSRKTYSSLTRKFDIYCDTVFYVFASSVCGFIMYMLVEGPIRNIIRLVQYTYLIQNETKKDVQKSHSEKPYENDNAERYNMPK